MNKYLVAFVLLTALPMAAIAVEQAPGSEAGPPGAGPPGFQSWAGREPSKQAPEKHAAAAAAHEQAAAHHKAAAAALQSGNNEQAREHTIAAEKAAAEAYEKSKDVLNSGQSK